MFLGGCRGVSDNGIYSKSFLVYRKDGNLVEKTVEYYSYPEENRKIEFTYNDRGKQLSSQTFNAEGKSIDYMLNVYDENATVINTKYGTSPDDINDYSNEYGQIYYEAVYTDSSIYKEIKVPKDIVEMNDNGQVIYEERYYGDMKTVNKMTYNEENKLVKSDRSSTSSYENSSSVIAYDAKGNAIDTEKKYEFQGHGSCHYSSKNTYTNSGQLKSDVSVLLGGECPSYIDEVKREYSYDKEGRVINVKAISDDGDIDGSFTTLRVIKEYTNELDI